MARALAMRMPLSRPMPFWHRLAGCRLQTGYRRATSGAALRWVWVWGCAAVFRVYRTYACRQGLDVHVRRRGTRLQASSSSSPCKRAAAASDAEKACCSRPALPVAVAAAAIGVRWWGARSGGGAHPVTYVAAVAGLSSVGCSGSCIGCSSVGCSSITVRGVPLNCSNITNSDQI